MKYCISGFITGAALYTMFTCLSANAVEYNRLSTCFTGIGCPGVIWEIKQDNMKCIAIENVNDTHKAISCVKE